MVTDVVMSETFTATHVLALYAVCTCASGTIAPLSELRVHFVPKTSKVDHPAWAAVRQTDGNVPDTVLRIGVVGDNTASRTDPPSSSLVRLVERFAEECDLTRRPQPDEQSLTPRVRRAIIEFVKGSHIRLRHPDDMLDRRLMLDQALQLFALAEKVVDEEGDIFLVEWLVSQAEPLDRLRLENAAGRAFALLEERRQSEERAREDLDRATVETATILVAAAAPDGTFRFGIHEDRQIVWGESREPMFTAFARKKYHGAVVVQCPRSEGRILVVVPGELGPLDPTTNQPLGTLSLVAATVRTADHRARHGAMPAADAGLCAVGTGESGVFGLNTGANAFGNVDLALPMSRLHAAALRDAVRHALIVPAHFVPQVKRLVAETLSITDFLGDFLASL
jgi:hypothetical protein